jgi:hypothetical protein
MAAGEFLPPVVTRLTGDISDLAAKIAQAKALIKGLAGDAGTIKIGVDTSGLAGAAQAIGRVDGATRAATVGVGRFGFAWTTWLKLIHYGLMIFGSQLISDAIGIGAFAIAAVHTLGPVFSSIDNLGKAWTSFSAAQKVAATHLTDFMNSMKNSDLQVVTVFDQAIQMLSSHMHQTGGIVQQASNAFLYFERLLAKLGNSSLFKNFLGAHAGTIQTDMQALFTLITRLAAALISLAHNFNFLGLWALSGIGMVLKAITWLNTVNPTLARVAFLTLAAYHAFQLLSRSALAAWAIRVTGGMAGITGAFTNFQKFGLLPTIGFMTGLSAEAILVGGSFVTLAALLGVAIVLGNKNAGAAINSMVGALRLQDQAVGTNIAGYQKFAATMDYWSAHASRALGISKSLALNTRAVGDATAAASARFQQAAQSANNLVSNVHYLEQAYNLTQAQAFQLAQRLNLLGTMSKRSFTANDKANIASYMQTLRQMNNPVTALRYDMQQATNATLGWQKQLQGLQNAFNDLAQPFSNTIAATVQWKDGNIALSKAVRAASGQVGYSTAVQRAAATQLSNSINNTIGLSNAQASMKGHMSQAIGIVQKEIAVLKGLHSNSKLVTQAIAILEKQMAQLKSKTITITANIVASGSINVPIYTYPGGVTHIQHAAGTQSTRPGMALVGERGPELVVFGGGQRVVPNHQVGSTLAAAAGGAGSVIENHIYLDGKELLGVIKKQTFKDNVKNSNRARDGRPRGVLVPRGV